MYIIVSSVILIAIAVGLLRAFRGPTLYDRVLAVNMVGTLTVLIVAVLGFMTERPEFLDIALVVAMDHHRPESTFHHLLSESHLGCFQRDIGDLVYRHTRCHLYP